jgi:hypothetical protein
MDPSLVGDIMRLVQSVDVQKMVEEVQATSDTSDLDGMVATMTKAMLGKMQLGGAADAEPSIKLSIAEAFAGKRKKVRLRTGSEQVDHACVVPPGCPDGHVLAIGPGASVRVRVARSQGGFFRDDAGGLCCTRRVSLGETRRLRLELLLPWGERVCVDETSDAPLVGWCAVRGAGPRALDGSRGDLFVLLELELPASWSGVAALADVPPLNECDGAATAPLGRATEAEARAAEVSRSTAARS